MKTYQLLKNRIPISSGSQYFQLIHQVTAYKQDTRTKDNSCFKADEYL